jgi:hypothetical protein
LVEDRLRKHLPEEKATYHKEKQKERLWSQPLQNETSESSGDEKRRKRREDARSIIAQARVNKARHAWKEENYKDDEKEMGALWLARTHAMVVRLSASSTNTRRNKSNGDAKFAVTPHRRDTVLVEYSTQRFHRKLGRTREPIRKNFLLNVQMTSIIGRS